MNTHIKIKSIELKNFKGIRSFKTDLWNATTVCGDNATGKTTLFDAFTWLMFGKDSQDRKDFGIKTRDADGFVQPKQTHFVEAVIDIDGAERTLRKEFKEKWQRRRGEEDEVFAGHETLYYIQGVPMKQADYQDSIAQIVTESVFKMVTNPLYFNSLPWQERREVVLDIAGRITNAEIIERNPEFTDLGKELQTRKLDDIKTSTQATIKKIKQDLKGIPDRIDELNQQMPEQVDVDQIQKDLKEHKGRLEKLERAISDKLSAYTQAQEKKEELTKKFWSAKSKLEAYKTELKDKIMRQSQAETSKIEDKLMKASDRLRATEEEIKRIQDERGSLENQNKRLAVELEEQRQRWKDKDGEKYEPGSSCPQCGYDLSGGSEEEFNKEKAKALAVITERGEWLDGTIWENTVQIKELGVDMQVYEKSRQEQSAEVEALRRERSASTLPYAVPTDKDLDKAGDDHYNQLKYDVDKYGKNLQAYSGDTEPEEAPLELKKEKEQVLEVIDQLNKKLSHNEIRESFVARTEQLMGEETDLNMELSRAEKVLFTIAAFEKACIEAMYDRIRAKFPYDGIEFMMYRQLINGGEEPACETLVDGVPWPDVNHGHKIKAGLSIVRTLAEHYGVKAPVWVDNAEAVVTMTDPQQQIIAMYAVPGPLKVKEWHDDIPKMNVERMLG